MDNLQITEYENIRVLTTQQIAEAYGSDTRVISNNFNRNKERYIEGKHYICLEDDEKREFVDHHQIDDGSKKASKLYLWTEKGAFLHAKSLNTDTAWEVYDRLVDNYFNKKKPMSPVEMMRIQLGMEFDSYCNEFDLGRKRIFVAPEMLTNEDGSPTFDPDDSVFYSLPEDYDKNQTGLIKEVDMSLRVEQHSKAIKDDLNYLSLKCGFGTERYRFDGAGVKTATEIISENSDMYRMLKKHETILEDVLERLIRIIIRLGIVTGNALDINTDIVIAFDDSIIEDKGAERQQDRQDVSMGVMRHEEYRAKWYGETVEQASQNLPEQNQVME